MTPEHRKALEAGRKRAARERRAMAKKRVAEFQRWIAKDCHGPLPLGVPSDNDYRIVKRKRNG